MTLHTVKNNHILQRLARDVAREFAPYDGGSHKLLSDNRAAYFDQSARTTTGRAAEFGERYAYDEMMDGREPSTDDRRY